jgi:hypothetical protein
MDTVARFHKVRYHGRILCSRVAPALVLCTDILLLTYSTLLTAYVFLLCTNKPVSNS